MLSKVAVIHFLYFMDKKVVKYDIPVCITLKSNGNIMHDVSCDSTYKKPDKFTHRQNVKVVGAKPNRKVTRRFTNKIRNILIIRVIN